MASSASSSLSRYRPSVIATASLAAAGSLYLIYCFVCRSEERHQGSLHRSNAIRRRHGSPRRTAEENLDDLDRLFEDVQQAMTNVANLTDEAIAANNLQIERRNANIENLNARAQEEPLTTDDAETEQSFDAPPAARDGSRLQELVYAIAKNNSEKEGIVHRGVTCDKCNRVPIVGVRYHCANCPDYDLCEDCEATDCHLKTHVFYKVKVPSPWGGKKPLPLWYPGDPTSLPSEIEDRNYKNRLSSITGFPHSKIDGLYQQFTCMANAKVNHPSPNVRMGIDRSAFDHCFIGQTMMDRPQVPNLVHDRLFAFYDDNNDGVVDFTEFVIGTSLIHSKNNDLRNKRVFRGLDLDNDGYISRKDCMKMFRAYYELNKDIMIGYLGIEREGENADFVLADREPRRHVVSGRSLASYFNDGSAGGYQTNSGTFLKDIDAFNDHMPIGDEVETITGPSTTNTYDLMEQQEVSEYGWLNLFAVYNDEIFRLCADKPMKWLDGTQVRIFSRTSIHGFDRDLIEHNGHLWAADNTYFGKSAYVKIEKEDMESLSNAADYRSRLSDPTFHENVHTAARYRLCSFIQEATHKAGRFRQTERKEEQNRFYLQEEPLNVNNWSRSCVGGTAAAHTIYTVIEDALAELLDPLFKPSERLAIEVEKSSATREKYSAEVTAYMDESRKKLETLVPNRSNDGKHPNLAADLFRRFFGGAKSPEDIRRDQTMVASALQSWVWGAKERASFGRTDSSVQSFLMYLLELEAELMVGWNTKNSDWESNGGREVEADTGSEAGSSDAMDPTMPQHRPNAAEVTVEATSDNNDQGISDAEVKRLARLQAAADNIKRKGAPGLLDLPEFERKMQLTDDNGNTLLQWIGGWLDLVMF